MENLEALKLAILEYEKDLEEDSNNQWVKNVLQGLKEAKQDLERLGVLEKKNQELYEKVNHLKNVKNRWRRNCKFLEKENTKLKQALDKACEKIDYTCPVEEELIEDLDCDNCDSNCKECWKKYFLKEVLGNE